MFLANFIFVFSHLKIHPVVHLDTYSQRKKSLLKEYCGQYSVLIEIHIVAGNQKLCKIYF